MSEEKLVPKLRFEYWRKPWKISLLKNICDVVMGQSPSSKNYTTNPNDTVLIQGNADLKNGKITPKIFTKEITKKSKLGDIILTVRAPVGSLAINKYDACIGRGVCLIRSDNNKFLYYLLKRMKENHTWEKLSQGSTFESINSTDIKQLKIKIPSKEEQEKIANFLSFIDKQIELLANIYNLYQNFKKGLLQQIFTQKLQFANFKIEYASEKVGKYLIESKISGVDDINRRLTVKLNLNGIFPRETLAVEKEGSTKQYIRKTGQFIYGKQNLFKGAFGIIPKYLDGYLSSSDLPAFDFKKGIHPIWFLYYFSRKNFYQKLENLATGTGSKRVAPNDFLKIKLLVPPLEEQEKIANFLSAVDKKIDLIQNTIDKMEEFKKGLLQQMFI